ncbi:helix-turn-helix domain-containing protein [Bradyrhizobium sp. KB893862 SZCCT0404]|uniref:helix-turn-helix domain-containing protein n=1 Tax=Bradyrhizobium sp. KB893862 SZCCT0404 TaxID=2807672 RepID=UPI001BACAC85|nr:helix-turn-helix domain-containing protein [Bradyrhizobium sp. KB893862 SZCCT0404]MBR1174867.1 helix-turn-helix domain-containing protein [Bradyrhizobium sp. KB893862 SZCCT0404]
MTSLTSRRSSTRKLFVWLDQVRGDAELSPVDFKVAYEIGQHFNSRHGGAAWPSSLTIATGIGVDKATVIRAVRRLRERGHLTVEPGCAGRGHSNRYRMSRPKIKGAPAHPLEPNKRCTGASERCTTAPEPLRTTYGDAKASPIEGERERSRALAVTPARALAPVGGAPEESKALIEDRFGELWSLWSEARSWPDSALDEFIARRSFDLACREAPPAIIIASASAWVDVVEPRYLPTLSKWLLGRGWNKQPPGRRQRNGGKVSASGIGFGMSEQFRRAGH